MASVTLDELSASLENGIGHHNTKMKHCIPPGEVMAVVIRYYELVYI
jgi:hypothetical protein